jgi:hypothetical protein
MIEANFSPGLPHFKSVKLAKQLTAVSKKLSFMKDRTPFQMKLL